MTTPINNSFTWKYRLNNAGADQETGSVVSITEFRQFTQIASVTTDTEIQLALNAAIVTVANQTGLIMKRKQIQETIVGGCNEGDDLLVVPMVRPFAHTDGTITGMFYSTTTATPSTAFPATTMISSVDPTIAYFVLRGAKEALSITDFTNFYLRIAYNVGWLRADLPDDLRYAVLALASLYMEGRDDITPSLERIIDKWLT